MDKLTPLVERDRRLTRLEVVLVLAVFMLSGFGIGMGFALEFLGDGPPAQSRHANATAGGGLYGGKASDAHASHGDITSVTPGRGPSLSSDDLLAGDLCLPATSSTASFSCPSYERITIPADHYDCKRVKRELVCTRKEPHRGR